MNHSQLSHITVGGREVQYETGPSLADPSRDGVLRLLAESLVGRRWQSLLVLNAGGCGALANAARLVGTSEARVTVVDCSYDGAEATRRALRDDPNSSVHFSDFEFPENQVFDRVLFRVVKSKAAVHHVINCCVRALALEGTLHLAGRRREGIKTYASKAGALLGEQETIA